MAQIKLMGVKKTKQIRNLHFGGTKKLNKVFPGIWRLVKIFWPAYLKISRQTFQLTLTMQEQKKGQLGENKKQLGN